MLNRPQFSSLDNFVFYSILEKKQNSLREYCLKGESNSFDLAYIKGAVGKGKTHLLHAVYNDLRSNHPELNVKLIDAWKLLEEFISALKSGKQQLEFNNNYQQVKALFIDNFEYCNGKEKTLWLLNNLFEEIARAGGKIFLTSNEQPLTEPLFTFEDLSVTVIDLNKNLPKADIIDLPSPEKRQETVKRVNQMFKADTPRDPARIPLVLKEIERVWTAQPDLRLTQLIINIVLPKATAGQVYNLEDEELLKALRNH